MNHMGFMALHPTWCRGHERIDGSMHYVYILQCLETKKLYTGRTDDLKRRLQEHKEGKVWTTQRMLPTRTVFYECFRNKEDAIRRERYLKTTKGKSTLKQMLRYSLEN